MTRKETIKFPQLQSNLSHFQINENNFSSKNFGLPKLAELIYLQRVQRVNLQS